MVTRTGRLRRVPLHLADFDFDTITEDLDQTTAADLGSSDTNFEPSDAASSITNTDSDDLMDDADFEPSDTEPDPAADNTDCDLSNADAAAASVPRRRFANASSNQNANRPSAPRRRSKKANCWQDVKRQCEEQGEEISDEEAVRRYNRRLTVRKSVAKWRVANREADNENLRETRRARWVVDPEFRERQGKATKAWSTAKRAADSTWWETQNKKKNDHKRLKRAAEPAWVENVNKKQNEWKWRKTREGSSGRLNGLLNDWIRNYEAGLEGRKPKLAQLSVQQDPMPLKMLPRVHLRNDVSCACKAEPRVEAR